MRSSGALLMCAVLGATVAVACATHGVDVSSAVLPGNWKCLRRAGYTFAGIRAWQSNGVPDPNAPHTIYNAWEGGMEKVDVYLFPDTRANAADQVRGMVEHLHKYNISSHSHYGPPHVFDTVWLDIEAPDLWSDNHADNIAFIQDMISEAKRLGLDVGVYTSLSQFPPIVGDWSGASDLRLWYANYDGETNFDDFRPFNGWHKPHIKQYRGTTDVCGASVDLDWHP